MGCTFGIVDIDEGARDSPCRVQGFPNECP